MSGTLVGNIKGAFWYTGSGTPPPTVGVTGDWYINSVNGSYYGPKASDTTWPTAAAGSLRGPLGPLGPQGPQGNTGATGATGPQGPTGATGASGATAHRGGTTVLITNVSGEGTIVFPTPFAQRLDGVSVCNGDPDACFAIIFMVSSPNGGGFFVRAVDPRDGARYANSAIRVNWVAVGL